MGPTKFYHFKDPYPIKLRVGVRTPGSPLWVSTCPSSQARHSSEIKRARYQWSLDLIFFNTWFTDFFQNIKVGGGKKIKIKITKKIFFI